MLGNPEGSLSRPRNDGTAPGKVWRVVDHSQQPTPCTSAACRLQAMCAGTLMELSQQDRRWCSKPE